MSNYNDNTMYGEYVENVKELIKITRALYKETKRLNGKLRNDKLTHMMNRIVPKTVLYDKNHWKKIDKDNKTDSDNIVISFK